MNKKDLILIISILLAAVFFLLGTSLLSQKGSYVTATVDGTTYGSWPLDKDSTVLLATPYGKNTFTIKNGHVKMTDADCPEQDCLHQSPLHTTDTAIICLPHHLVLEIHENGPAKADALAR